MSPPEVWGPAVWTLFHTLIEKLNPNAYPYVIGSMFGMIIRICKVLPCPECSRDASNFLAKLNLKDYKTKDEFKNMIYLFHNWVNAKKRKPLYNYINMNKYSNLYVPFVINDFIAKYNTKGNMKLLAESFQRKIVIKDLIIWFKTYARAFIQPAITNVPEQESEESNVVEEPTTIEEETIIKEKFSNEYDKREAEEESLNKKENCLIEVQESLNITNHVMKIEEITKEVVIEEPIVIQQHKKKRSGKSKKK